MRIAVLLKDRCHPKKCSHECYNFCPRVRIGDETIVLGKNKFPQINEGLCVGCGICVNKCPYDALKIINLKEELETDLTHQFSENGFRLFRLPVPTEGKVVGILGPNGIGKTTVINILSGQFVPNLGNYDEEALWDDVLDRYSNTRLYEHFKGMAEGDIEIALKPQYVDKLPGFVSGSVRDLLYDIPTERDMDDIVASLEIEKVLDRNVSHLSGGELQRIAIAATVLKDADMYFFDEPSSYLDISQRLNVSKLIHKLTKDRKVMVIEHDLAVMDFLSDTIYLMYGSEGGYGIVAQPRSARNAINTYLRGFLSKENVRIRDHEIRFQVKPPRREWKAGVMLEFPELTKEYPNFILRTGRNKVHYGEVIGMVGPNAIGKTTYAEMLVGRVEPDEGGVERELELSYKPQYLSMEEECTVKEYLLVKLGEAAEDAFFTAHVEGPLGLEILYDQNLNTLSGGELQRVALGAALGKEADMYLLDEPSAYLDSDQRMSVAKAIRRVIERSSSAAMIVDHDVYFIDLVSDSLIVFTGEPSVSGLALGPFDLRTGMNRFLKNVNVTFRRDKETHRPRVNKSDSRLDREQKSSGEYYYT